MLPAPIGLSSVCVMDAVDTKHFWVTLMVPPRSLFYSGHLVRNRRLHLASGRRMSSPQNLYSLKIFQIWLSWRSIICPMSGTGGLWPLRSTLRKGLMPRLTSIPSSWLWSARTKIMSTHSQRLFGLILFFTPDPILTLLISLISLLFSNTFWFLIFCYLLVQYLSPCLVLSTLTYYPVHPFIP